MKIKKSAAIEHFLIQGMENLTNANNSLLDVLVTKANESQIQEWLHLDGHPEFVGSRSTWPSLFINTKAFLASPYYQQIKLDKLVSQDFEFGLTKIQAGYLFSIDAIKPDPKRMMKDWLVLRALDEDYEAVVLKQHGEVWMLNVPSESVTIDPYANKAHGRVLTFGLGIGYFCFMALLNSQVDEITVVELSDDVIKMFNHNLLTQFPRHEKINIIQGDALDYFNKDFIEQFDYVFVDIWRSNDDGLVMMERLFQQYLPGDKVDCWIESSCTELVSGMVFAYFYHYYFHRVYYAIDSLMNYWYKKVENYFKNVVINDVETMQYYIYDQCSLRKLIAGRR
jgi:hypothetical protein